jgi:thiamine biosynthesis lipoprotein
MRAVVAMAVIAVAAVVAPVADGQVRANQKFVYNEKAMGTWVSVFIWTDDEVKALAGKKLVMDEMHRLDVMMSNFPHEGVPSGDVIHINDNAGRDPVVVSDETFAVLERSIDVSKRSGGVFDITVGAFYGVWKFDENMDGTLPDPAEVKKRLALVGWKDIVLDPAKKTVLLRKKGMAITLGGIAKGYAVDKAVALLRKAGYANFMVQAGGDMYIAGDKDGDAWTVGIRDPRGQRDSMFATAPIKDHSFSTSGDYERGFVKDGVRYHHILDPRTGQPAHASRSVTIRATDAFTADAWSKVMFIDGWKEGLAVIEREKLKDFDVVWVDDKNEVHMTPDIQAVLRRLKDPTPGP